MFWSVEGNFYNHFQTKVHASEREHDDEGFLGLLGLLNNEPNQTLDLTLLKFEAWF